MRKLNWLPLALVGLGACDAMDPEEPGNLVPATVVEDPGLPAIDMNGTRLHLETRGDPANPVIVFLHGGPGGDYRSLLTLGDSHGGYSLAGEYFLVYWDQRGAGLSARQGKDQLTQAVYRSDLDTLIDRYSPSRPVYLIGVSWGGMFATDYINRHPERVAGAVLIEPGPLNGATAERIKDDLFDLDLGSEWLNDWAWNSQFFSPDDHARMDYERMLGVKNAQPRSHVRTDVDPEPAWRMGAAANRYITEDGQDDGGKFNYDFTTRLAEYTTPVLFVAGSLSEVLGPALQEQQVLHYPSASLYVVNGAGHDAHWTHTQEVLAQVRAYLDARRGAVQ